jgi:hypothetical protein
MTIDTTRDIVLRLEGTVNQVLGIVCKLDKDINGNGTPGLKTNVINLTNRITDVEKRHCTEDEEIKKKENRTWDMRKSMLLLAVTQFLTVGGLILVAILRIK